MEVKILNKNQVLSENLAKSLENTLKDKSQKLDKLFKNYPKPVTLEVHVSDEGAEQYRMAMMVNMKSKPVYVHETGKDIVSLVEAIIEKLQEVVIKHKDFERKEYLYKRKEKQVERVGDVIPSLDQFKEEKDRASFVYLFNNAVPNIKKYMVRRVAQAQLTTAIRARAINVQDLVDELYLRIYEKFYQRPDEQESLIQWVYREADQVLEENLNEINFEKENFSSIEDLLDAETKDLEERYSVDAEGDYMMMEEFDDPSYKPESFLYEELLPHDQESAANVTQLYEKDQLDLAVNKELSKLPVHKRTIFDLYIFEKLEPGEIANIKNSTVEEIQRIIDEVRAFILERLAKRMDMDREIN